MYKSFHQRIVIVTLLCISILFSTFVPAPAHAAPKLKAIEHWGVVQMPTKYSWPGRGPVVVERIKLLTESENKGKFNNLSFSVLVVTQKYIAPWDAAGELRLVQKKKNVHTLDLSKQQSWLKVSESENTGMYMLNVKASELRLPLNELLDIDVVFSTNPRSKLTGAGMPNFAFGIFDKTMQVTDDAGNQFVTNLAGANLDAWGVSQYFGVSLWNQSRSERKRLINLEKEEAKYIGKNMYLKQRAELESESSRDNALETSGFQEKNAMGYIKSKTRNGIYDVEFISGSDGKLPINLVSFSKVK